MSNSRKAGAKPFSLERYRSEVKGEPFVLWLDDENTLEIPRPTGDQLLDAEEAYARGTSRDVIEAVCGDKAEALLEAVGSEDASVLLAVGDDLRKHFGLGN